MLERFWESQASTWNNKATPNWLKGESAEETKDLLESSRWVGRCLPSKDSAVGTWAQAWG